jgi:leader peptidase (prepilin peptidase) / N-methyltransferase
VTFAVLLGAAGFGLLIGSFLNVVIWRAPRDESVVSPPSTCPGCGAPIAPRDNVPVLSWLLLHGRARCCGERISARYPLVELATAAAFAGVTAWWWLGSLPGAAVPAFCYLAAITVALTLIDIDVHRLPDVIVLPSYPVALVLLAVPTAVEQQWSWLGRAALGALLLFAFYFVLVLIYPAGMGLGDVKLAGVLGLYLGWLGWPQTVVGLAAGFALGGVLSLLLLAVRVVERKSMLPYGPFMLAGTWLAVAVAVPVADWYLGAAGL